MTVSVPDDARRDLAPEGRLRAALNFGNPVLVQRDPASGAPRGVAPELAEALGRRLGVPVDFVPYETAGQVSDSVDTGAWTMCFLADEPARAATIAFTAPYVIIEGTYLVPDGSALRQVDDVDRPGVRVAVGHKSAYDLFLTRTVRHATLVRAPSSAAALDLFRAEGLEAAAGIRQPLVAFAERHPGLRVMEGRFMAIAQAMGVPRAHAAGAAYLRAFVEDMKAEGVVAALRRSGQDPGLAA